MNNASQRTRLVGLVYKHYQEAQKGYNALDFKDILDLTIELIEKYPEAMQDITDRYHYVMINEYQDMNPV